MRRKETHSNTELGNCGVALGNGPSLGLDLYRAIPSQIVRMRLLDSWRPVKGTHMLMSLAEKAVSGARERV